MEQETDSESTTVEDFDAEIDQDAFEDGNITGTLGILNPFVDLEFDPDGNDPVPGNLTDLRLEGTLATQQGDNHFEIGNNFVTRNEDGTVTITPLNDVTEVESESEVGSGCGPTNQGL